MSHSAPTASPAAPAAPAMPAAPAAPAMPAAPAAKRPRPFALFFVAALLAALALPALNQWADPAGPFHVPDYALPLVGKYLCYAMVALAMDLVWGYAGALSLGHGVFFAFGGYAMGMHLMRSMSGQGNYKSELPDFMVFLDWKELPWWWYGFDHFAFAALMVVLAPALVAFLFGWLAFRSRIRGVYFSIITQAFTYALMLAFFRNELGFGGNNGLTDFKVLLGFDLQAQSTKVGVYVATVAALALTYLGCRWLVGTRFGRVIRAVRDAEERVRFSGYDTLWYKLFVWTLSAALCGVAGALYVPQAGIINPSELHPAQSIEIAIWVAVGGRGTLFGPALGAFLVNGAESVFTDHFPDLWLYFLAFLFIGVTLFFPKGVAGILRGRRK